MTKHTRTRDLARAVATQTGCSYQQALTHVERARKAGALPSTLYGDDLAAAVSAVIATPASDPLSKESSWLLGYGANGSPVCIDDSTTQRGGALLGGIGSGRTSATRTLLLGLVNQGWSPVVIDLTNDNSGESSLRSWCEQTASNRGLTYQESTARRGPHHRRLEPFTGLDTIERCELVKSLLASAGLQSTQVSALADEAVRLEEAYYELDPSGWSGRPLSIVDIAWLLGDLTDSPRQAHDLAIRYALAAVDKARPELAGSFPLLRSLTPQNTDLAHQIAQAIRHPWQGQYPLLFDDNRTAPLDLTRLAVTYIAFELAQSPLMSILATPSLLAQHRIAQAAGIRQALVVVGLERAVPSLLAQLDRQPRLQSSALWIESADPYHSDSRFTELISHLGTKVVLAQNAEAAAQCAAALLGSDIAPFELRRLTYGTAYVRQYGKRSPARWVQLAKPDHDANGSRPSRYAPAPASATTGPGPSQPPSSASALAAVRALDQHLSAGEPAWQALEWAFLAAGWGADLAMELLLAHGGIDRARVSDVLGDATHSEQVRTLLAQAEQRGELLVGVRAAQAALTTAPA